MTSQVHENLGIFYFENLVQVIRGFINIMWTVSNPMFQVVAASVDAEKICVWVDWRYYLGL